jgi:1-acyl-sn-glycerol-3-phosphate acyltransferase
MHGRAYARESAQGGEMATLAVSTAQDYRTRPHAWQTQIWARALRRIGRHWVISRHVNRFCRPLEITGAERLRYVKSPVLVMMNHSSHFDTPVALTALPERVRSKTAVAAAADRFYLKTKRGWWYSLFFNTFPIDRLRGGSATLDYARSLLRRGWSVLIYPEGTRSTDGQIGGFHHGIALLALSEHVPVLPLYAEGLRDLMPKGQRAPQPAPVRVRIGVPVTLDGVASVPEGTAMLEDAMRALSHAAGTARPEAEAIASR